MNSSDADVGPAGASTTFVFLSEGRPADARNFLKGRVINEEFVGAAVTIHIEIGHGPEIRA